jgi:hypothetical protein
MHGREGERPSLRNDLAVLRFPTERPSGRIFRRFSGELSGALHGRVCQRVFLRPAWKYSRQLSGKAST